MSELVEENHLFVGWHAEPSGRGAWCVLSTCLITMGLCVVKAIHLNIPGSSPYSDVQRTKSRALLPDFKKQAEWLMMGLFAPELVVYSAWLQYSFVKNVTSAMKEKERGEKVRVSKDLRGSLMTTISRFTHIRIGLSITRSTS
jgi:hypothetical protein